MASPLATLVMLLAAQETGVVAQSTYTAPPVAVSPSQPGAANYVITPSYPPPVQVVPTFPPPSNVIIAVPQAVQAPGRAVPAVPFPTLQPGRDIVRQPVPRRPLQDYVTPADYPVSALAMRQQGWVDFTLTVDTTGHVAACKVTVSSGSPSLDFATCRVLRSRARFTPAIDSHGNPAVGTVSGDLEWTLPQR
jgi:periplasmic protein TonB